MTTTMLTWLTNSWLGSRKVPLGGMYNMHLMSFKNIQNMLKFSVSNPDMISRFFTLSLDPFENPRLNQQPELFDWPKLRITG